MKFRKKPVVIEAFRLNCEHAPDWFVEAMNTGTAQRNSAGVLSERQNSLSTKP